MIRVLKRLKSEVRDKPVPQHRRVRVPLRRHEILEL